MEALERQVAELKRRNEELSEENGRRARKDDETASLMSTQKAKQEEQVWSLLRTVSDGFQDTLKRGRKF